MFANEAGSGDPAALEATIRQAVREVVRKQAEVGIDVLNDGEMGKISYAAYVKDRLSGFDGQGAMPVLGDILDYPDFGRRAYQGAEESQKHRRLVACDGPIAVKNPRQVARDVENLKAALEGVPLEEVFMSAASPGVIALFFENQYFATREAYLAAIADAMQFEYETIAGSGFLLQVDCPDLAMGRHLQFNNVGLAEFQRQAQLNVDALNHATRNIPAEQMRMHICWGNYEGPHHKDVALKDIIDIEAHSVDGFDEASPSLETRAEVAHAQHHVHAVSTHLLQARVKDIPQPVADEVQRQQRQKNGDARQR